MSRENFFVKATTASTKDSKGTAVTINISRIDALVAHEKGTQVLMSSGVVYICNEPVEHFTKAGAAYGVMRVL